MKAIAFGLSVLTHPMCGIPAGVIFIEDVSTPLSFSEDVGPAGEFRQMSVEKMIIYIS